MKVLKVLLILLGVIVLIGLILGFTGPKTYQMERTTVVAASPEAVWPYVSSIRRTNEWSPFLKMDTTMKVEYVGNDGEVGSLSKWTAKSGKGEQTLTVVEPNKSTQVHLKFFTPMGVMESDGYINLEPDPAGTKVIWGFKGENNFVGRIMSAFHNMDKSVGPAFESGLADLKTLVETNPSAAGATHEVVAADHPGATFLAVKADVSIADMEKFYSTNLPLIMTEVQKAGLQPAGMPTGIYYTWDMEKGMTTMAAGIPVKGDIKAPKGMEVIHVPAHKSLSIKYMGGYHGIGGAHEAMDAHLKSNNLEHVPPVLEEYVTDPGTEPDSNKWVTVITYFVK